MRRLGWAARSSRGQSLVEFALVLPLIVLLILGVLDLGRGIYAFNTLAESARQANRLAIVDQNVTRVTNQAIASAPALGLSASDIDVCFKLSDTLQRDCATPATDSCATNMRIGCLAIVTSRTTFSPVTPLFSAFMPSITVSSTSIGPVEYVCPTSTQINCP